MAAKRLGRDREAEELWRAARTQLPQLTMQGWDANQLFDVPNLLIFELLLEEAEPLFTKESGPPLPVEPTPPAGRPASPN